MDSKRQKRKNTLRKWRIFGFVIWATVKWFVIFCLIAALFAGGAVTGYVASLVKDDPVRPRSVIEAEMKEDAITGFVYFNDGAPIGQLRTEEDRRPVKLEDIPQHVIDAVLSIEDNNFKEHPGVDLNGLGRAVKQKLFNEDIQTGGSTLTQQLARRVFLNLDVTDSRKFKEIFLSLRLERFLTKDEILTAYLNKVPFGNGSSGYNLYGIKAASKGIFNISNLKELNIAQAAYLAGLPQRPSAYTAFNGRGDFNERGFNFAIDRQQRVLKRMLETGRITESQYEEAKQFDIRDSLAAPSKKAYSTFPYLMLEAERQAAEILLLQQKPKMTLAEVRKKENAPLVEEARQLLLRGGYYVHTTIDKKVYNLMRQIGSDPTNFTADHSEKGIEQIAAMMIDHKTGAILGMLEGRDFYVEQMNYATQMTRQPGSAMKPVAAYLPALEAGLIQPGGILDDSPIILKDGGKGFHIPKNANNRYSGLVTARDALNRSLNIPALKLFNEKVTIPKAWEFAKTLGITTLQPIDDEAKTGVLGGLSIGVTVEELTNAYGAIANNGIFNDAYMISKITDSNGKIVYQHKVNPERVFSEETAFLMTDMLRTVITNGTATSIKSMFSHYGSIPVAGKTGSTQNYGDVWFMGYSPDLTLGVWAGYKEQKYTLTEAGKARARSIWSKIMDGVADAKPELFSTESFSQPEGIVKATVSGYSGKLPSSLTRQSGKLVTDWFNKKFIPKDVEDSLVNMSYIVYNGVNYIPQSGTPDDMLSQKIVIKREKPLAELMSEIEAALSKMPSGSRRALSYYVPTDAGSDAPYKVDPRVEDGRAPAPPANVRLNYSPGSGSATITFNRSPESDVVGYRLYRAANQGSFQRSGSSLLAGQDTRFTSSVTDSGIVSFYVTAVDVGGNESAPSQTVTTGTPVIPQEPESGGPTGPETGSGGGESQGNVPGSGNGNAGAGGNTPTENAGNGATAPPENGNNDKPPARPSAPSGLSVEATDNGIKMNWSGNPSAELASLYNIYYSQNNQGSYRKIASTNDTFFEYVTPTNKGWFRISAVNLSGEESDLSGAVQLQ
ncbi:carboxypeptidase [Paenibacillaceae bacterium]|nr:carboxypeptidase [Paenibacillaceae bacterium]